MLVNLNLDVVFLQEVGMSDDQLQNKVGRYGYTVNTNIFLEDPSKPGTAIVWRTSLPVKDITSIVVCRAQVGYLGGYALLNIYAPSGSDKKYVRGCFFSKEIFRALSSYPVSKWIVGGDFNCVKVY